MSASISCVVPVYNGARYLAEALDSILAQTLPPTEIIVVDDGSTDATAQVTDAYAKHVIYVRQANAGPASARNRGIGLAKGDFISFLDADDLWHKDKLERQHLALQSNPAAGICITYLQNFWVEELAHERDRMRDHGFAKPMPGYVCQCLLARRSVFDTVGCFDESKRLGEDQDWFLRADRAGIIKETVTDALVYRRIHGQNMTYEVYEPSKARADLLDNVFKHLQHRRARAPEK
ncbi:MAG: glycosyltransferase family A protein [Steroidobacteraceae bacterium]